MSERYSRLFSLIENLYAEGAPVIISAGALLKDNQTGKVLAQLKFTNIQNKQIKALKVKIYPKDTVGNALGEPIEYQYLDLTAKRDNEFASNVPIVLSDAATRSFDVEVTEAIFTDNSIWNSNNSVWERLPSKLLASDKIKDAELLKQYQIEFGKDRKYAYSEAKDLWYCACGAVNKKGEHNCHSCKISAEVLTNMDLLKRNCEKRLAEEAEQRRIAAEKAAEEARRNEIQKQKTKKIAMIATPIFVAVIAFIVVLTTVIIPNSEYNAALALMEEQKYEEAIAAFEAMDGYKDSVEQIKNCENAIVEIENEAKYNEAVALVEVGNYVEAYDLFLDLGNYKDSTEYVEKYKYYGNDKGDIILLGSYEQDNYISNGKEPIEWIVLSKERNKILLISANILDFEVYGKYEGAWEKSILREWLNSTFYDEAFNDIEKKVIEVSTLENYRSDNTETPVTTDRIFALSQQEMEKYSVDQSAKVTNYAKSKGVGYASSCGHGAWWSRTLDVDYESVIIGFCWENVIWNGKVGVRPAMWINIEG